MQLGGLCMYAHAQGPPNSLVCAYCYSRVRLSSTAHPHPNPMATYRAAYPLGARALSPQSEAGVLERHTLQAEIDALVARIAPHVHEPDADEHEPMELEALLDAYENGYAYELHADERIRTPLGARVRGLLDTLQSEVFGYVATRYEALCAPQHAAEATLVLPMEAEENDADEEHAAMLRALIARAPRTEAPQPVLGSGALLRTVRIAGFTVAALWRRLTRA